MLSGTVTGQNNVGGIVGDNQGYIKNTYSHANVYGNQYVGGIVGNSAVNFSEVSYSYSVGNIAGNSNAGGIVGNAATNTAYHDCYSLQEPTGVTVINKVNVLKKNIDELKNPATYVGWDNVAIWDMGTASFPKLINVTYMLVEDVTNFGGGNGTYTYPFKIMTTAHLENIKNNLGATYILEADLQLAGYNYTKLGDATKPFFGILDGNNKKIFDLTVNANTENNVGMVGVNRGTIKNLGLIAPQITGADNVGSFTGTNYGNIENCFTAVGKIKSNNYIGGICGKNAVTGKIENSFMRGNITLENMCAGGIVGSNAGTVKDTYYRGKIQNITPNMFGSQKTANIIGINESTAKCLGSNFYSSQEYPGVAVEEGSDANIIAKTNAQMDTASTYASWDANVWSTLSGYAVLKDNGYLKVNSVQISKTEITLEPGKQEKLDVTVLPVNATYAKFYYESNNENIAVVDSDGNVIAKKAGTAEIKAIAKDGEIEFKCNVEVLAPTYIITIPAIVEFENDANGKIKDCEVTIGADTKALNTGKVTVDVNVDATNKGTMTDIVGKKRQMTYEMFKDNNKLVPITNTNNNAATFTATGVSKIYLVPEKVDIKPGMYEGIIEFLINYRET